MKKIIEDKIFQRAVNIWGESLGKPVHDNGDPSEVGMIGFAIQNEAAQNALKKITDFDKRIDIFKTHLFESLKSEYNNLKENEHFSGSLSVDYHPCAQLRAAVDAAGLSVNLLSIKSSVSIYEGYVTSTFGYGHEYMYHYPLDGGKWLMTNLAGNDIGKIIALSNKGIDLGLKIE